jgi:hypothetical protein
MAALTRDAILKVDDLPKERVEVPEWGGYVFVKTLTGAERDAFEQSCVDVKSKGRSVNLQNLRARLLALSLCDDAGSRLFTVVDVEALGAKSGKALDRLFAVAQKLSGLGEKDVEELTGN